MITKIKNKKIIIRLILIIYSLFLVRLNYRLVFEDNFWGDECFTIKLMRMSFKDMITATAEDVHPPLYYIYLMPFVRILGEKPWVLHIASIIPMIMVTIFIITVIWKRFGTESSFFLVTMVLLSPVTLKYNLEVRMYSLAFMFIIFAFYGLLLIIENPDNIKGNVLFVVAALGAAYTHYYAMMSVAIMYASLLVFVVCKRINIKRVLLIYVVTIIGYLPWLFKMVSAFKNTAQDYWMTTYPGVFDCLEYFYKGAFSFYSCGMLGITMLVVIARIFYEVRKEKKIQNYTIWSICGIISALGIVVIGEIICIVIRPAFSVRYLTPVAGLIWISLCVGMSKWKWSTAIFYPIILFTIVLNYLSYNYTYNVTMQDSKKCQESVALAREQLKEGDIIFTDYYHYQWTVSNAYFPQCKCEWIDFDNMKSGCDYYLLTDADAVNAYQEPLSNMGFNMVEIVNDGLLGTNPMYFYKLEQIR